MRKKYRTINIPDLPPGDLPNPYGTTNMFRAVSRMCKIILAVDNLAVSIAAKDPRIGNRYYELLAVMKLAQADLDDATNAVEIAMNEISKSRKPRKKE